MRKWVCLTPYQTGMPTGWKSIVQAWKKKAFVRIVTGEDTVLSYQRNITFQISMTVPAAMGLAHMPTGLL
ncbi:hypothetical protein [Peribacillus sp. NPDC097295]|uniref:hypothetical protein n=1 Tax=Peribacillus sp. NPDC097295 TaxID=3364402 RepID=UPI0037FCC1D3